MGNDTLNALTGMHKLEQLIPSDAGGQYDSSGGYRGQGNPQGSVCLGYNHYVEPRGPRACIRCCDDPADCPTNKDTLGFSRVIEGITLIAVVRARCDLYVEMSKRFNDHWALRFFVDPR
ncbi:hypothetical protein CPB85DRAFT_401700 [Mucidula mucida]|nr:hypothetical protein CPB85DRAFT_401700 [Mucidula mucida]